MITTMRSFKHEPFCFCEGGGGGGRSLVYLLYGTQKQKGGSGCGV